MIELQGMNFHKTAGVKSSSAFLYLTFADACTVTWGSSRTYDWVTMTISDFLTKVQGTFSDIKQVKKFLKF